MYNYKYKHDEGLFYMGGPIYNCKSKVPLGSSGDGDKHPSCPLINGTVTDTGQAKPHIIKHLHTDWKYAFSYMNTTITDN